MRLSTYAALALNASTAFLMSNYLLVDGWIGLTLIVGCITLAAYAQGYRFATTQKQLPRAPYLVVLVLYTSLFALPPMSRLKAAIFAYSLARLLMFRALWLTQRHEAYLHLLMYFAVVATCFGHWRADWTLLPLLGLYIASLLIALAMLHTDTSITPTNTVPAINTVNTRTTINTAKKSRRLFPWFGLSAALPMTVLLSGLLLIMTPLLPGPHWQLFPDMPRTSTTGEPGAISKLANALSTMAQQQMRASTDKSLQEATRQALTSAAAMAKKLAEISLSITPPPAWVWWLVALLIGLLYALWRARHTLWLSLQVNGTDPLLIYYLQQKKQPPANAPLLLYGAFERLWHYHGTARHAAQTPSEHLHAIQQHYGLLSRPSAQLVSFFHHWRYSPQPQGELHAAIKNYRQIRLVLSFLQREKSPTPQATARDALAEP